MFFQQFKETLISLWLQCTLPKVKVVISSFLNQGGDFYQMTSDIEEIMFSFDYKNHVLELSNKIAACVVYYSLLR